MVVLAETRDESKVFIIRTIECPRKEEINEPIVLEGVAEVVQVSGNKRHGLHCGWLDDALKHNPFPVVLQDSCADEFCAVQAPVALSDKKHIKGVSLSFVGGHDAHHVDVILYARHVSPLSFAVTVIQLLLHIGQVQEGADASVAAATDYERAVGRVHQQELVEVGHELGVLAGRGRRRAGPSVLFGARFSAGFQAERRPQLVDVVDRSQVDATGLGVLDHIVDGGLWGELQDVAALLLGPCGQLAEEEEEEGDPACHLWGKQKSQGVKLLLLSLIKLNAIKK